MAQLGPAIVLITSALVFYTIGVWAEHRAGVLKPWHTAMFGLGLVCDATGTWFMSQIAASGATMATSGVAAVLTQVMSITGALALVLMAVHFGWALWVLARGDAAAKARFHRFSLVVWGVWLVPYFTGMAASMVGN